MVEVVDPTGVIRTRRLETKPLPADMGGLVVGILDNAKPQSGVVFSWIANHLTTEHGAARAVVSRKATESLPADHHDLDVLAQEVHLAVGGLAE